MRSLRYSISTVWDHYYLKQCPGHWSGWDGQRSVSITIKQRLTLIMLSVQNELLVYNINNNTYRSKFVLLHASQKWRQTILIMRYLSICLFLLASVCSQADVSICIPLVADAADTGFARFHILSHGWIFRQLSKEFYTCREIWLLQDPSWGVYLTRMGPTL